MDEADVVDTHGTVSLDQTCMKNYDHQQKIISDDPHKTGLFLGTGSGKTRIALNLARGSTLVVCPKTQRQDGNWERELASIGNPHRIRLTVISKEEFRRDYLALPTFDTLIGDEAHTLLGVTPNTRQVKKVTIPKTSQIFEALDWYVTNKKPKRIYLCTATIVKSPMTVWGAAKIFGKVKGDVLEHFLGYRSAFYVKLPMPGRDVYVPKKDDDTKDRLATLVHQLGYVGRLEDYFDVPEQTFRTVYVQLTEVQKVAMKELPLEWPDPIVLIGKKHQLENGSLAGDEFSEAINYKNEKQEKIFEYAEEFPRMVIFAKYRAQIAQLELRLKEEGYKVLVLTGDTKDRGALIAMANQLDDCIFIAQAQISAGWELPNFPVMIFASRTYSYVDYSQALGRILRANALKKNLYINLVVKGGVDEAVDKALANKQDFDERVYTNV